MSSNPVDVVLEFEKRVNSRSAQGVAGLLTPDSVFVDSLGSGFEGVEKLRRAWEGYFKLVPDYNISHEEIFERDDRVALFGTARGDFFRRWPHPEGKLLDDPDGVACPRERRENLILAGIERCEPIRAIMRKGSSKQ